MVGRLVEMLAIRRRTGYSKENYPENGSVSAARRAFSLIELSMVLVVIGLLVGGILLGRSIIVVGQQRALLRDLTRYQTVHHVFTEKYNGQPGDLTDAYTYWQGDSYCNSNTTVSAANNTGCNGNGDGIISATSGEAHKYWLHLRLSGLIEGSYNGYFAANWGGSSWWNYIGPGTNMPSWQGKQDTYFMVYNYPLNWRGWTGTGTDISRNRLTFANWTYDSLTVGDAQTIDGKVDDGRPGSGTMTANILGNCTVGSSTDAAAAEYDVVNKTRMCGGLDWAFE